MKKVSDKDALQNSDMKYRALFDNAPVGISVIDASRNVCEANRALEKVARLTTGEIFNGAFNKYTYIKTDGTEYSMDELPSSRSIKEGKPILDVEIGIAADNKIIGWTQVSAAPVYLTEWYAVVITQDITDRKNLEINLKASVEKYRSLFENSMDAIFLTGPDGLIYSANPAACILFGRTAEEIIKVGRNGIVDTTDPRLDAALKERELKGRFSGELTLIKNDGTRFPGELTSNVFYDSEGRKLTSTIIRDVSEQRKREAELRKSKELQEKLNQHMVDVRENERNQIALNLHDDLGQKLTAINLDIAWLKNRIGVQSQSVKEKFQETSQLIVETIESIKVTASLLRPAILFDFGLVPAIKVQLLQFEKQTGIKCHFDCELPGFMPDNRISLVLYRILQESLTNIARHSGASVTEISLHVHKNKLGMSIKDNGKGIKKSQISSLKSMGIEGIKERVRSAQGKLSIRGINGSGTTIKVIIPLN